MFLHIGNNKTIPLNEVIAIIDINSFYKCIFNEENNDIKSYIITWREKETIIYTSNISSSTLLKRSNDIIM